MSKSTYVVATDLSTHSTKAAQVAARLAARSHAALDLFCAVPANVVDDFGIDLGRARASAEAIVARHAELSGRAKAHVAVVLDVAPAIVRYAQRSGATLLVVAPRGVTGWKKVMLGSVTEYVLRHATVSVLVARPDAPDTMKKVLVGVMPGPSGRTTLRHAIATARALGAELTVMNVVQPAELILPLVAPADRALRLGDARLAAKTREFERWVAGFPYRGVDVTVRVVEGSPAETLVGEARRRHACMVVVGASDKRPVRRALLGSVAHAVASTCQSSVMIVRGAAE
jgi:nucleotide-binding universal stress UspA family protein